MSTMDLMQIHRATAAGDYRALWIDLIRALPACSECGRTSTHVLRLYPQNPPSYLCSRNECVDRMRAENVHDQEVLDGWEPAPWIDHVMAAELSGALRE